MNYPKDPVLGELGRKLTALVFSTPLTEAAKAKLTEIEAAEMVNKTRGVKMAPGNKEPMYLIQSYVGGSIRSFGSVRLDIFHACRLADLLTHKFGHLRLMYAKQTEDKDFNYTREQAKLDYEGNQPAREVVDSIFSHLLKIGAVLDPDNLPSVPPPPSRKSPRQKKQRERTQLDNIESMLTAIYLKQIGPIKPL